MADMNEDAHLDLVVVNRLTETISVLLNNGDGSYAADILYGASQPQSLEVVDLDGDTHVDFAIASFSPELVVLRGVCRCPADLDGDGAVGIVDFLDLLAAWGPC